MEKQRKISNLKFFGLVFEFLVSDFNISSALFNANLELVFVIYFEIQLSQPFFQLCDSCCHIHKYEQIIFIITGHKCEEQANIRVC